MNKSYNQPTYAVFGDVGAHYGVLRDSVIGLGVTEQDGNYVIPHNLTIIQLGDLVNKGPNSNLCVQFVDAIMETNNSDGQKGQWIQLIGNHESNYIPGAPKFWPNDCDLHSVDTINRWWDDAKAKLYYMIPQDEGKPFIVTHSGVSAYTYQMFQEDEDYSADAFMKILDYWQKNNMRVVSKPGIMLTGKYTLTAGVFWAEAYSEVYNTWKYFKKEAPFHQIHGHSTAFDWSSKTFYSHIGEPFKKEVILDPVKRHSLWSYENTNYYGIDPGFGKTSQGRKLIHPLMLNHAGVIS